MAKAFVVDVAGELGREVQVVAHDVFKMDPGYMGVGEQCYQCRFAFVVLILRDAPVVHRIFETEPGKHLALRETKPFSNSTQLTRHSLRSRARVSHQELPPDGEARFQ